MRNLATSYLWSPNCLENFIVSKLLMEVLKCWKIVEFLKTLIEMKNFKSFYNQPNKSVLHFWNKNFRMKIYKNIQTFLFDVLRKCSSWVSSSGAFEIPFLKFLAVLREYNFCYVECIEVRKMSEFSWAKLYCKMTDPFWLVFVGFENFL